MKARTGATVLATDFDAGVFVISLDTELAWARIHHRNLQDYRERLELTRSGISWLLQTFESFGTPATWAVVGHLFLDHCSRNESGTAHPDLVHPDYAWVKGDWYDPDPCSSIDGHPEFYGSDVVQQILANKIEHEIGSHSFGHLRFRDPGCNANVAKADIGKCVEVATEFGVKLTSFVFPQDMIAHLDVLLECGFKTFRGILPGALPTGRIEMLGKLVYFFDSLLGTPAPVGEPKMTAAGVCDVPLSMHFRLDKPIDSIWSLIPMASKVRRAKRGLERAANQKRIFHLALHPLDFGWHSHKLRAGLVDVLEQARKFIQAGKMEVRTMGQLYDTKNGANRNGDR